jgi:hypothetical protein
MVMRNITVSSSSGAVPVRTSEVMPSSLPQIPAERATHFDAARCTS